MIHRRRARAAESEEVNLSPLIDVTFLLLIFFVVTSTFAREAQLKIERPESSAAETEQAPDDIVRVARALDGTTYLDGEPVQPWLLQRELQQRFARRGPRDVLLIVDRGVDAGQLVTLIDACKLAGATAVALATRSESGAQEP